MREISYYPGCSLHGTAREYDESIRAVSEVLGLRLQELQDWTCCGSSSAHCTDEKLAIELAARNLAIAEKSNRELLVPCATCYNRFKLAENAVKQHSRKVHFPYRGDVLIRYSLDFFTNEAILEEVKKMLVRPLSRLRVVCYYGCLTVRPPKLTQVTEHENPRHMDRLMKLLGAEPLSWSCKTDCCGAGLVLTRADIVRKLTGRLLSTAKEAEADCVVTGCPMCQGNLDTHQEELEKDTGKTYNLPIFYFTELIGLALGHRDTRKWFRRHITDPVRILNTRGLV